MNPFETAEVMYRSELIDTPATFSLLACLLFAAALFVGAFF